MSKSSFDAQLPTIEINADADHRRELKKIDGAKPQAAIVVCRHDKGEHGWTSLIHTAQKDESHKALLINLINRGFHIFKADARGSLLVHRSQIHRVWDKIIEGDYIFTNDHLVYHLTYPKNDLRSPTKLLVIFSPVASNRFSQLLDRHFSFVFKSIADYIHDNTLILRIADLGGVVGSFYLPTRFAPDNNTRTIKLIESIRMQHKISNDRVLLYGASKGATGALYTSLHTAWGCVAVDPIVSKRNPESDPYYAASDIFLEEREQLFLKLAREQFMDTWGGCRFTLITSPNSAEYESVYRLAATTRLARRTQLIISHSPLIEKHVDVAPQTIPTALSAINAYLAGFRHQPGVYHLP